MSSRFSQFSEIQFIARMPDVMSPATWHGGEDGDPSPPPAVALDYGLYLHLQSGAAADTAARGISDDWRQRRLELQTCTALVRCGP